MKDESEQVRYDKFIRSGLNIGFTDDQIDFLWDWINSIAKDQASSYTELED